jgi:hypothetical protein
MYKWVWYNKNTEKSVLILTDSVFSKSGVSKAMNKSVLFILFLSAEEGDITN